ncbi:MAG: phasin family protein [Methylocystis sp.]|nr:phasin family protein [Methylocystis sp.]MBI3274523.1 phasin family protein [Methylocystis sp.]
MAMNPKIPGRQQLNQSTFASAKSPQAPAAQKPGFANAGVAPVAAAIASAASERAPVGAPPQAPKAAPTSAVSSRQIDASALSLKSLELFQENAAAMFDYAAALGKVKSVTDAFELQSQFVRERYSTFVRQTTEVAELTRRCALDSSASLRRTFMGSAA